MKLAFCAIVKASDEEAIVLHRLLKNVKPYVDDIFITITGENKNVESVANAFDAKISKFEWIDDFAAARNFNFSQVPKDYDYILWADADDSFRGLENLRTTIEENPKVDAFAMFYLYAFDEDLQPIVVHTKTQVVRNDGCVEWVGQLHEDFKPSRELNTHFIKGVERLHLSDEDRFDSAKERNLKVAEHQLEVNPQDPRSFWNVANSLKALGKNQEAIDTFNKFLDKSNSDDEKYIVRLRMAESYYGLGDIKKALDNCRYAIGLMPNFPDAYFLLGSFLYNNGNFEKAAESYLSGLVKPKPYYKILVFNPRDYDYVPMMNLAKCYFSLLRPDLALPLLEGCLKIYPNNEKLNNTIKEIKKETKKFEKVVENIKVLQEIEDNNELGEKISSLPIDIQSHPMVCKLRNTRLVKKGTSGKDLVIFAGYTNEEWTPDTAKTKGIGGSEEAVIWLSRLLVERGWNVTVYNNCGHKELKFDGVTYKPFWSWNSRDEQDVIVFWRTPRLLDYEVNSKKIFVDLHDVVSEGEFTEARLKKIDKIFVKSAFHRSLFPNIEDDKFVIIPNGIDYKLFEDCVKEDLIINTSSPDRSLSAYIDIVKKIKRLRPVRAVWAYGWGVFDTVYADNVEMMDWKSKIINDMEEVGIENLGRISHNEVAELYKKGKVFLYPSEFAEIDCISLTKAMAAGCVPVTTDFSAMGDKRGHGGVFIHSEKTKDNWCPAGQFDHSVKDEEVKNKMVEATIKILDEATDTKEMKDYARTFDWELIADKWNNELND